MSQSQRRMQRKQIQKVDRKNESPQKPAYCMCTSCHGKLFCEQGSVITLCFCLVMEQFHQNNSIRNILSFEPLGSSPLLFYNYYQIFKR
jgi:hypothetical protein